MGDFYLIIMSTKTLSAALIGLEANLIEVEADYGGGELGQISIVGLPDTTVSEAKERVRSALKQSKLDYPQRKITVNLAPADIKKRGSSYDLPIAVSILALKNSFKTTLTDCLFAGELSLSGELRPIKGAFNLAMAAADHHIPFIFLPIENAHEVAAIKNITIFPVKNLLQVISHLQGKNYILAIKNEPRKIGANHQSIALTNNFSLIQGQEQAKRALIISLAGGHHLLLWGSPGSGKTMLASSAPELLPDLTTSAKQELAKIYGVADTPFLDWQDIKSPFRAPHHSASAAAIIGGGVYPQPGEISLAHHGVLFLDELPEFPKIVLESLRQPLEKGEINLARANSKVTFPANFCLIGAMNPCPCGYDGDPEKACVCSLGQIKKYREKISGPLLDRFDLVVKMSRPKINYQALIQPTNLLSEQQKIKQARQIQHHRLGEQRLNAYLSPAEISKICLCQPAAEKLLNQAATTLKLSGRAYYRCLKSARTIADLEGNPKINEQHLSEALAYRFRSFTN